MTRVVQTAIYSPPNWIDPLDWQQVFARPLAIEVDIGCGKGSFLLWAAQRRPGSNFVGVERLLARLRKVDRKIQRLGLANVRLLRIEAGYLVARLIPAESVAVYHIYFPDPWPKRRHRRRRLFTADFVSHLHRTLQPGGVVNIATDCDDYFSEIKKLMSGSGRFVETQPEHLPPEARTDFEREFLAAGREIGRCRFVRRD